MSDPFLERLQKGVMLCDGAMGTLLYMRGVSYERSFDEQNLSNPKIVLEVHQDYIKAGAEIVETNTFGANQVRLKKFGLEDKVSEINFKGVKIAREAREIEGKDVFVAGSMGPLGKHLTPLGEISEKEAFGVFQFPLTQFFLKGLVKFVPRLSFDPGPVPAERCQEYGTPDP